MATLPTNSSTQSLNQRQEKLELIQLLMEKERRMGLNPLKYSKRHYKQYRFLTSDKVIRALFWGNRVGKTEVGAQAVADYVTDQQPNFIDVLMRNGQQHRFPYHKRTVHRPIEIWCACPSYDVQKETTQKKLERYIPPHLIKHITYIKSGTWGEVELKDGTKINFKSYEQGRSKFQGAGKRVIWFDEEPPRDIWEECFVRSEAGVPLDIILTMTPVNGMTWVYDEIYLDTDNPDLYVDEAEWDDNPFLTTKQKDQMGRGLSPQALQVRQKGKFVKKTGLVCGWFDRSVHITDLVHAKDWDCSVSSLDFGFSNPCCWGLFGVDYDDNINLFEGFYERQLTTPKICERIYKTLTQYGLQNNDHTVISDSAQAQSIQEANDYCAEKGYKINFIGVKKESGTKGDNWDEYRAQKMDDYGATVEGTTKFKASRNLKTFDERKGVEVNWFMHEAGTLKWSEVASASGEEKQQGGTWDTRYANHAIDMYTYFLVDHLTSPDRPRERKPWEGKLPGTFIEPSVIDEETNDWGREVTYDE